MPPKPPSKGNPHSVRLRPDQKGLVEGIAGSTGQSFSAVVIGFIDAARSACFELDGDEELRPRVHAAMTRAGITDITQFARVATLDLVQRIEDFGWPAAVAPSTRDANRGGR